MVRETTDEPPLQSVRALLGHLREHPADAALPPRELADRFGLETQFVQSVLVQAVQTKSESPVHLPHVSFGGFQKLLKALRQGFDSATGSPRIFIAVTTLLGACLCVGISLLSKSQAFHFTRGIFSVDGVGFGLVIFGIFLLHMACYLRRAMARHAVYGALIVWVISSIFLMVANWLDTVGKSEWSRTAQSLGVALALLFIALWYTAVGTLFSVLGGWLKMKRQDRQRERMSRQDLLERYFELQKRLEESVTIAKPSNWEDWPGVRAVRQNPYIFAFGTKFVISILIAVMSSVFHVRPDDSNIPPILFIIIAISIALADYFLFAVVAFLAGSPRRAAGVSLAYMAGYYLVQVLPFSGFGIGFLVKYSWTVPANVALFAALGTAFGAGAVLQKKAVQDRNLQRNDQASLMAEMLQIQWRLSDEASLVCVLVIDAVRSSDMKNHADPLAVEYSFRLYQIWIENVCRPLNGQIHSTAGDGAVVSFLNCPDALRASKRLQTELAEFNRNSNRLPTPFRIRIGLHAGNIHDTLSEVQFSEVIDVAAHIQAVAPIGGIAVSEEVVALLADEEFVPLSRTMDDHPVFIALNPIEE